LLQALSAVASLGPWEESADEDLLRLKSLIEDGLTSAPGKEHISRQDVAEAAAALERGAVL